MVVNKKPGSGSSIVSVTADNASEARQKFKYAHPGNAATQYKIIAVVKTGN
jgi:hypothetical protein